MQGNKQSAEDWAWEKIRVGEIADFNAEFGKIDPRMPDGWSDDRKIGAGTEWKAQIDNHLNSAHLIFLLISADFVASDYCYDVEMKRAMERHDAGEARVIPIILKPCDWHNGPFGKLQALPKDGRAVTDWSNRDKAFTDVAKGIRAAVAELAAGH